MESRRTSLQIHSIGTAFQHDLHGIFHMGGVFVDTIKRVQDLMQERDMNVCVLAKKCGISYSTIQTTARRGGQLSVETIERICLGLGITLKDFFDSSYL